MRILVINPNRVDQCTDLIRDAAAGVAEQGTDIVVTSPIWGPVLLHGQFEVQLSATGVLDRVAALDGFDAVVMAGFGEPGREAAQELTPVPVLDITECAPTAAKLLGRTYAVVTTADRSVPIVEDRLRVLGHAARCAGIVATGLGVPELVADRDHATRVIVDRAQHAVSELGADVVVLGCGGMAGLAAPVSRAVGAPVVDGVTAAVKLAETLHRLDLRPTHDPSRPSITAVPGWPLPAADTEGGS